MKNDNLMILRGQFLTLKNQHQKLLQKDFRSIHQDLTNNLSWCEKSHDLVQLQNLKKSIDKFTIQLDSIIKIVTELEHLEPLLELESCP